MKILILEDDPFRHRLFLKKYPTAKIVETAKHAIALLECDKWDALFLDHDLGGQAFVQSGVGTGYEVASWLEQHPQYIPPTVVLHSLNPAGRQNMKAALPDAIEAPFIWMDDAGHR